MIYIPLELQLQWIREDLEQIKSSLSNMRTIKPPPDCQDCNMAKIFSTTCPLHAPEFNMRITFPLA
jgi:hypothetical protein